MAVAVIVGVVELGGKDNGADGNDRWFGIGIDNGVLGLVTAPKNSHSQSQPGNGWSEAV